MLVYVRNGGRMPRAGVVGRYSSPAAKEGRAISDFSSAARV